MKRTPFRAFTFLPLFLIAIAFGQAPGPDTPAIEQKINAMIAKLTLEQKIDLISGVDGMAIRSIDAISFPRLRMSDGPVGVRTWGPDTAYTAGIALAATWNQDLARQVGVSIARDARARGVNFLLGPGVNIYRAPMNGRNFEYFGEDPFLASRTVVGYVEGVQSQGVVATVKHFALNNQEYDRHNVSSDADERTMREIYLPVFEAAVREGHVGAVMNSYNLIKGVHATQNDWLNNQVLKKDWGFNGILMSDWDSTYDAVGAANGGLDLEMPFGKFMNRKNLLPAIQQGKVLERTIDDKVRRILRTSARFGFLDREQEDPAIPLDDPGGRQVAREEARESIVLLKNENAVLPLDPSRVHTVALIGPDAWPAVTGGGGSSTVTPYTAVSLLSALTNHQGTNVLYSAGLPSLRDLFDDTRFDGEVNAEVFSGPNFTGSSLSRRQERLNDWRAADWTPPSPAQSIRYTAKFTPQESGNHLFLAAAAGQDAYKVLVDGKPLIVEERHEGQAPHSAELQLTAGKSVSIQVDYAPQTARPRFGLAIKSVEDLVSKHARQVAALADAVIVSVGFDQWNEGEGFDRTYALPFGQDALISSIASINKKTVVLLTAGGDVDTHRWLDRVPVLLHNWYPGEEGGTALTEILFGERSPEGKLPISFAKSWEENPVHDSYYASPVAEGQTPHVKYSEGVFLGYRYYTTENKKPLFPFGFGLSYTTFSFSHLEISPSSGLADRPVSVKFDVTNSGRRTGADVAQLYLGDPSARVRRPAKELKGFEKIRLDPGETRHVEIFLDKRCFSYWDEHQQQWTVDPGRFDIFVGDSSESLPLTGNFTIQ